MSDCHVARNRDISRQAGNQALIQRFLDFARNDRRISIMDLNKSSQEFPYKTYLNTLHGPLELIDVQKLADACTDKWYNQTLCKVNDSVVRMAVVQGEYHWHEHKDIDEFFFALDGRFLI